ncbi:AlkA N-terminal domain-containing protein [Aeromicrobium sp. CTD01-1L150]|uniref:AlkA N-terminal domain-containing protein n=1 Tax=Aeromicrobium sp. CTD01-1L150 TaxID=3341830 RepID=UPI0035C1663D
MDGDFERHYRAVSSRDARFDGVFFTAVRTTGIYCRPSCPARTPRPANVEFHRTAAAAESAGFRACRRCRPDASPGSPEWDVRADVVGRAVRMVRDGVVERDGVSGLARRLGYSERHLTRLVTDELGVGPLALARSQRVRTARVLAETTELPLADLAFVSGFASVRQFNASFRQAFGKTPREMRARGAALAPSGEALRLRLAVRRPFHAEALSGFLADHAVPGVERGQGRVFARTLDLPRGHGVVEVVLHDDHVACRLQLADARDLTAAVARVRRMLDLDADPAAVDSVLAADPRLAPLVAAAPGLRLPGSVDGAECAVRTVVGQQVSVAGAATVLGRLVAEHGAPVSLGLAAEHGLTHTFPAPEALAAIDPETIAMPRARGRTLARLAHELATGGLELHDGVDRDAATAALLDLPGIGPWTAGYVRMRGLGDPDVLLDTDLVLRRALQARGIETSATDSWSPWRSYAGMHLWHARKDEG